jgi:hypothetical protein
MSNTAGSAISILSELGISSERDFPYSAICNERLHEKFSVLVPRSQFELVTFCQCRFDALAKLTDLLTYIRIHYFAASTYL